MNCCGKFDEITILRYIDRLSGHGGLDNETVAAVSAHLLECPECMDEVTELNRIGAVTDSAEPVHIALKSPLTDDAGVIPSGFARFVSAVPVRGGENSGGTEIYTLESPSCEIRISRKNADTYRIAIVFAEPFAEYVELRTPGSPAPLFLKKPESKEVDIRSAAPGKYDLSLGGTVLHFELRP